jgi:hypothetical protein
MEDVTIRIRSKKDKISVSYSRTINLPEFMTTLSTAILGAMLQTLQSLSEDEQAQAKAEIFDMYNAAASNTLHLFDPEADMRPGLTAQAILEKEDEILDRQYKEMKKCKETSADAQGATPS